MKIKAEESPQIKKARQKILRQIEAAEKRINPEALDRMSLLIKRQLTRHSPERISLKSKSITLFDENRHSAQTESRFIKRLMQQIEHPKHKGANLEGRISSMEQSDTPE